MPVGAGVVGRGDGALVAARVGDPQLGGQAVRTPTYIVFIFLHWNPRAHEKAPQSL
jgi:hypothetical protein